MKPKLSILMLTYNRLETSSACIQHILNNVGNIDFEFLVWDNGSTDGTYDWLEEYGRADCRITKVFGSEENLGMEAINKLAKEAKGKYLLKVDDDITVPEDFAQRLVDAYEKVNESKLLFLGWDMKWTNDKSFALRSGLHLYKGEEGKIINLGTESVLLNFTPSQWLINGACRLCERKKFMKMGGHPKGMKYGVDYQVSKVAEKHGYWIGFFNTEDLIIHNGHDSKQMRNWKDKELKKHGAPKHHG